GSGQSVRAGCPLRRESHRRAAPGAGVRSQWQKHREAQPRRALMPQDSFWRRLCRGVRRVWGRADWDELLGPDWADGIMEWPVTDRFHAKQGRTTGRLILEQDN